MDAKAKRAKSKLAKAKLAETKLAKQSFQKQSLQNKLLHKRRQSLPEITVWGYCSGVSICRACMGCK